MDFKTILKEFVDEYDQTENDKNIRAYQDSQSRRNKGKAIYLLQLEEMLIVASENQQIINDIRKDVNQAKKDLDGKDFDFQMDYINDLNDKWGITTLSNMNVFYPQYTLQVYCI